MKAIKIVLFAGFILGWNICNAQTITGIKSGEKLTYVASYYMSSLWTDLAEFSMEVNTVTSKNKELYHLKCMASTYTSWDSYFKIRDSYQSWVDVNSFKPLMHKRDILEGSYSKSVKYVFKWSSLLVNHTSRRKSDPERTGDIKITAETTDIVSLIYKVRYMDFKSMKPGEVFPVTILFDHKLHKVNIKYHGIESIKNDFQGRSNCYRLSIMMDENNEVIKKETNGIWITEDSNRIPVLIKAEIPVGSVQIRLVNVTGI